MRRRREKDMRKLFLTVPAIIMSLIFFSYIFAEEAHEDSTGIITGRLVIKGVGPMMGGTVFFFNEASGPPPSATKYWRVPTEVFRVDENAGFTAILPEGKYYMGAIERHTGELLGPPQEGDYFFISQDKKGKPRKYTVKKNATLDLGIISGAKPFKRTTLVKKGITAMEGSILNEKGEPAAGMLVFAFTTPTMVGRPLFVSERSDKDGKYLLRLYRGGKYYLRARANYGGGPPSADEVMGIYKDGKPISIKTGQARKGIDVTVARVGVTEQPQ
jgi:hypothetical protein